MSDILLQKLVNCEINLDNFKKWFLSQENNSNFKCSQSEFLTYFLNLIHEEINTQKKFGETSLKCTPRKIKPTISESKKFNTFEKSTPIPPRAMKSLEKSFSEVSDEANTSTPKVPKIHSDVELNKSYYSPISPLYQAETFITPRNKKHSLCLGDFIVKKSSVKKKHSSQKINDDSSKRITPTALNDVKDNESFKSVNSFNDFNTKEIVSSDLNQNRLFLAKERLKILSRRELDDNPLVLGTKKLSVSENKDEIEPQPALVTYHKQINIFSDLYIIILKNNLVLNITGEIYFLISLLLLKQYHSDLIDDAQMGVDFLNDEDKNQIDIKFKSTEYSDYFESIHNIVYFAVKCLEELFDILKYYDKSTLNLFSVDKRIKTFSPKFSEKLRKISDKKSDRIIEIFEGNPNVCYNLDTDTKDNFASEVSFLSFRKQRDLFYEILRVWEKNHSQPEWSFQIGLGGKIKSLLSLQGDPANFMHIARLFKAQLMSSCGKTSLEEDENDALSINFPSVDPSKLNRLKNRLVTRQSSNGLNALPNFTGHQEFYKEFIVVASNYAFNVHLCDTFVSEIVEINENSFNLSGLEETGTEADDLLRKCYAINIRHLRVLAKFLGFVESLPYKSNTNNYPENMFKHHVNIRGKKTPSLDIKQLLISSIKQNKVILTIPWLVKYLSMLDYITLRLPYYLSVYEILFQIYHSYEKTTKNFDYNASLVKFCLGWLFDLPHFPDTEYVKFCANRNTHFIRKSYTLDDLAIVDQTILYSCCPYLEEIKKILTSNFEYRSVTVKHITPVTAVESAEQISKKRLEQQMEEAFFNGQPESVKKIVEFVSERLASVCVKHICTSIVPLFKKNALKDIKNFLEFQKMETLVLSPGKERTQKTALRMKVSALAEEKLSTLRDNCGTEVSNILSDKLSKSIDSLLSLDTLSQTRTTCISISSKMCRERIKQWINSHLTINIFTKDVERELQKVFNAENRKVTEERPTFALPSNGRREKHNDDTLSGFHLADKLKCLAIDILERSPNINREVIKNFLSEAFKSINERCDLNDVITSYIFNLLLDLALLLIVHMPDVISDAEVSKEFVKIWQSCSSSTDDLFKDLLCPKNVALLQESSNQKQVWHNFAAFVAFLIKEKALTCDNFESQCTAFFRKDWDQIILNNVCYFMKQFVDLYKQNGGDCSKFTILLEFLSEFCMEP